MSRMAARIVYFACLFVGMMALVLYIGIQKLFLGYIAIIAILGGTILSYYLLRCPGCGRWANRRSFFLKYCPHCGKKLED